MFRTTRRRSATYASSVALAIALVGGSTVAAVKIADNSVESRHIKNGAVRSVDIADNSITGQDLDEESFIAEGAKSADFALEAGQAETAERILGHNRATVSATGKLRSSDFGAVRVDLTDTPGRYNVDFGGPIVGCFWMASVAHNEFTPVAGFASAWMAPLNVNPNGSVVTVETHAAGSTDAVPDPLPFQLLGFCGQ